MAVMGNLHTRETVLSETLQDELKQLLQLPHIATLSQNLRRMFLDYLEYELETAVPVYFDEFLYPLNCLFDFLDVAAKEAVLTARKKSGKKKKKKSL